jgi:hypothetical protein
LCRLRFLFSFPILLSNWHLGVRRSLVTAPQFSNHGLCSYPSRLFLEVERLLLLRRILPHWPPVLPTILNVITTFLRLFLSVASHLFRQGLVAPWQRHGATSHIQIEKVKTRTKKYLSQVTRGQRARACLPSPSGPKVYEGWLYCLPVCLFRPVHLPPQSVRMSTSACTPPFAGFQNLLSLRIFERFLFRAKTSGS